MRGLAVGLVALALAGAACSRAPRRADPSPAVPAAAPSKLDELRAFESARRREARFLEAGPRDRTLGPDPYALADLGEGRLAGILRGDDALVVLDAGLAEIARVWTPR